MLKPSNKILLGMVGASLLALVFGFLVLNQRSSKSPITQQNSPDQNQQENLSPAPSEVVLNSTVDWKIYTNDKHGFSVKYPSNLKAGAVSENSALGTFEVPVRGLHLGPLLLIALKDVDLKKQAQEYFNAMYDVVSDQCRIDKVTNTNVVNIKSVSCTGEGGAAKYAYITGESYDVFVDGYSKGYDNSDNGEFKSTLDYVTVLSTFVFSSETKTTTSPPVGSTTDSSDPNTPPPPPTFQSFTIAADDTNATPNEISVTKDAIVQITFNVGANVYYGGLEFRSSVVNSGMIAANATKTISFKATESFLFTPYWPASQVAKNYTIKVNVQ